ncbi:MAG TPA: hypothetical protein VMW38_09175 [Terriglobia bacterium]|nr:hypothetical protein [Terriglobia bacterium]
MFSNLTYVGFCLECRSYVQRAADGYSCQCGAVDKSSNYIPSCWVLPAQNITPVKNPSASSRQVGSDDVVQNRPILPQALKKVGNL